MILDNKKYQDIPQEFNRPYIPPDQLHHDVPVPTEATIPSQNGNETVWDSLIEDRARDYAFLHHPVETENDGIIPDSLRSSILHSLHSMHIMQEDPIDTYIRKRNLGTEPFLFNFSDLVPNNTEKVQKKLRLDFIPTEGQIRALNHLFEKGAMQDTDLYPILNTEDFKTYDMYRNEMDRIVSKGLVSKEKVSPEQLFILFFVPIEMNSKNKKNPEYRYEPLFSKKTLIDFLQARHYILQQARESAETDSIKINSQMKDISKKLSILLD
ncbi:hypothetical protein HQ585_01680 [candidate division KSB1 bacterium]|nr:hypothetical protein [candidate division KSB1 bacterium]